MIYTDHKHGQRRVNEGQRQKPAYNVVTSKQRTYPGYYPIYLKRSTRIS